jgi:3-keto-L-gulonate-6-phosphate decarboxylase
MQGPTDEASVPPPTTSGMDSRILSGTMRRKIGIRTYPWPTAATAAAAIAETPALPPSPPPPPEDEDRPAAKKPRLQAPSITMTSAAIREDGVENVHTAERVTTDSLDDTPTVPVTHTPAISLPSAGASRAPRRTWNAEEDTKLAEGVKRHGTDWVEVAALVHGRTNRQCRQRRTQTLDPGIRKKAVKWTQEEDTKLIEAVKRHGIDWVAVAALVPGRTNLQCRSRWIHFLDLAIGKKVGKWTPEENTKLAEAVKRHGTDWVAVAALVPGRTNVQCHHRWTQTLDRIGKKGVKWTQEEDAKLIEAVKNHGTAWVAVAALVPGRANEQCRKRWTHTLDLAIGKKVGKWTPEENTKLAEAVKRHGTDWVAVAALVPGRMNNQCCQRWTDTLDPDIGKKGVKWTQEENTKLIEAVKKHGTAWVAVAALVHGRTKKQCRRRWTQTLDPAIEKIAGKWKPKENTKLAEAVKRHGTDWVAVAALVHGRTNLQCHQRWTQTLDHIGRKGVKWTQEEDAKLIEAVKKHGTAWVAVAALVPGRANDKCRKRWTQTLDPAIGKIAGKWTPEEKTKLIDAVKKHGTDWVAVAALVHGRTNRQCRQRWTQTLDPDIGQIAGEWIP